MTDNALKLLLTETDLHNLKSLSITLEKHLTDTLKPCKDTLANEARRAIGATRKVDQTIMALDDIIKQIHVILGEGGKT